MKKLTDVLKYNKEIQKKNQGAVINQNNAVKQNTTPFVPVRTNVSDARENINPIYRFNSFLQTTKGQEISAQAREKYSYFNDVDDYIGRSAYMRQYLPESIKFFHSQAEKQQDMVIEYTQGREIREDDYSAIKEYKGIKSNRDSYMEEERNKRNELASIYDDIANHLSDKYSPEQIADYYSYYSRIKPEDTKTLEAIKKAEQLYYSKADQREYDKAIEDALSGSEEAKQYAERGAGVYTPRNITGNGFITPEVFEQRKASALANVSEDIALVRDYLFGKYDYSTAEKMYDKYVADKKNKEIVNMAKDDAITKNLFAPIYNIGTQVLSPIYGAETLIQQGKNMYSGKNEPVSMYSPGTAVMKAKDASAEAFTVGDSEGTAFLKNVLLSVGGNAANVALFGAATPYMMALQSGSSTAYETMKKGGTTQQAVLNGVIGGTIEYFTEKLPFEELTKTFAGAKGLKSMSKADVTKFIAGRIGLQAVSEYGEETVNSYASTIADIIVMGEKSDYMQYVNELVKDGKDTEQAYEIANKKFFLSDPQMAGLSGLISGGLMASGSVALGTMKAVNEGKGQVVTYTASDKLSKQALDTLNNIAKAGGVNITVEDLAPVEVTDENGNKKFVKNLGEIDADGTIRINSSQMGSVEDALVAYHEVTHALESTKSYDAYRDIALNIMYGGRGTDAYNQAMSAKSSQYGDKAQGTDSLEKELVAEFTRTQLSNEGVVEKIVAENRNVATKIYNALKKAYTNIKNKLQGKETNLTDMEKAINLFEKALAENRKMSFAEAVARGNTDTGPYIDEEGNVQFSEKGSGEKRYAIETLPDGKKYVQADRQVMFSSNPDSWGEDLEKYVNDEIRKGKDVKVTSEDGNVLTITAKTAWKLGDRNEVKMPDGTKRLMTDDEYATKLTAGSHIDEIAQLLKGNDKYVPDTKDHDFAKDGFTYKNAFFRDFDGTYYRLGVSIGKSGEIKTIYNIGNMQERSFPDDGSSSPKGGARKNGKASKNNIPHQEDTVNTNNMQKGQNDAQGSNGKQHLLGAEIEAPEYNSTAKSRTKLERYENEAVRKVADAMSVRLGTAREFLKPIIQQMSTEYMKTGKLSQETVDRLFEEAYKNGKIVNDEAYKGYADLRNYLRNTKIYFDSESAADIPDFFKDIRRYMGRLSVSSTSGTSVDSIYQELNEMHPNLFPDDILASSDRMLKIMEVSDSLRKEETTLDAYYNTDEAKGHLKHEFEEAVYKFRDNLWEVKRFNDSLEKKQPSIEIERNEKEQVEYLKSAYSELSSARKNAEKVMGKLLITEEEKEIAEKVISGAIRSEKIKSLGLNTDAINKYIEAYGTVRTLEKEIKKENTKVQAERIGRVTNLLENSDNWKDKKWGWFYARETQERNIEDITANRKEAKAVQETIFEPIDDHEAESNRYKNNLIERIDKLKISQKVARGNKHSEAYAIQFLGETQGEIEYLEEKLARYGKDEISTVKQKIIDEYKNAVDYKMLDYIQKVHDNPKNNKLTYRLSDVHSRLAQDIERLTGINVEGFSNSIKSNSIGHIEKDHGVNGKTDKSMADANDIARMQYVIDNYDSIELLPDKSKEYRDKNQKEAPMVKLSKRVNGTYYVVEAVPDTNKHQLAVVSAYKKKAVEQQTGDVQAPPSNVRNASVGTASTDNVSQKAQNVNSKKSWIEKDREKLAQLKRDAEIFIDANPKLDYGKIDKCIGEFRNIYNELFEMMNETRIRNGYAPVEYRKNYFPHFVENKGDSFLNELGRAFGFDLENKFFMADTVTSLPTEILGRTADRKPGIKWLSNALHRSEDSVTDYDVIDGFAKYITGVCDVIFHTDDIQNVRAFANAIRYKYSDDGVKEKIKTIGEDNTLTDEEKAEKITEKLQKGYKSKLGNYAVNLDTYADILAGKQVGGLDRAVEKNFGRETLRAWSRFQGRIGANMIVGNAKTPFMNFATIPQAMKELSPVDLAYGMFKTLKNIKSSDGFDEKSTFLTNRVKVGNPDKIKTMTAPKHFLDAIGKPLEFTDALTSGLIWRARYHQNTVQRNMTCEEAIKEADTYTKKLIAGRSYGSMPTLFYSKSGKVITQYMLETNNLLSNITKDLSRYVKNDSKGIAEAIVRASWRFIKYSLAAELLADLFEKWFGNDGIQSPLGIVFEGVEDFTGFKVPNVFDAVEMLVREGAIDFSGEQKSFSVATGNLGENILEDLPFTSIISDGRIPVSGAMFDVSELLKVFDDPEQVSNKKKNDIILNELIVPLSYQILPAGAGQLKKTVEGINAYSKGGSYKVNNKGEEELQYPIDKNGVSAIKTALWGKSSTKGSRDWVDEGFGSLTSEQTELYQRIIEDKKTSRTDVYNAINAARKAEGVKAGDKSKTETQARHEILKSSKGLTPSQKAEVEISFYSKGEDGKKGKREKAQDLINFGIAPEKVTKLYYDYDVHDDVSKEAKYEKFFAMTDGRTKKAYEKWGYEPELSVIKREALANDNSLSPEEKQEVNKALFGETKTQYDFSSVDGYYYSILTENQQEGYDTYIKNYGETSMNSRTFWYVVKVMNSQKDGKGSKRVDKVARLRKIGVPLNQANRIYNILE